MNATIEAHKVRIWVNKATAREGRTQHRVMYYTPTLGKAALVATDGFRIHAAWDVPDIALIPSKRILPNVRLLGSARRNNKVIESARNWMREQNQMSNLLGKLEGQQVCTVFTDELRRCLMPIWNQYRDEGCKRGDDIMPVYLWFVPTYGLVSVYSNSRCIGTARAIYTRNPSEQIIGLQLPFLWDALTVHYGMEQVELAQVAQGIGTAPMFGIGAWMHRYALLMPLSKSGKLPDAIRAEVRREQ